MRKHIIVLLIVILSFTLICCEIEEEVVTPLGTKFIAHRGLSGIYYQNSETAFIEAAKSSFFYGIETDIWLTSDGIWVCAHDIDPFADTTKMINEITYAEAITLPLNLDKAGEAQITEATYICDFVTYLNICKDYNKIAVIELKSVYTVNEINGLLAAVQSVTTLDKVQFISFERTNLTNLRSINNQLVMQILTSNAFMAQSFIISGDNIGVKHTILTLELIASAHNKNLTVNVWTVNDIELIERYVEWKVDYITTDYIYELEIE